MTGSRLPEPTYSPEETAQIAELLRLDPNETVKGACIKAGIAHKWPAIRQGVSRFNRGEDISERVARLIAPIVEAVEWQCAQILELGDHLSSKGKLTTWQQWKLEKKSPTEYGHRVKTELTGADDGPVRVQSLKEKSDDELIELMLATSRAEGDEQ